MRIFHYTNIETLALILKNRTIRFSRLDTVDDPIEYGFIMDNHNPAKYTYVSCWTKNNKEVIPQWIIYGNHRHGVRISMENDIFKIHEESGKRYLLPNSELTTKDYITTPILSDDKLFYDIEYVQDPKSYITNIFKNIDEERKGIDMKYIGLYKGLDWTFQKECRFRLFAFPKNKHLSFAIENNIYPNERFIDVPIQESAFKSIEIMLGPDVSTAEQIIVESLSKEFLGSNKIINSNL